MLPVVALNLKRILLVARTIPLMFAGKYRHIAQLLITSSEGTIYMSETSISNIDYEWASLHCVIKYWIYSEVIRSHVLVPGTQLFRLVPPGLCGYESLPHSLRNVGFPAANHSSNASWSIPIHFHHGGGRLFHLSKHSVESSLSVSHRVRSTQCGQLSQLGIALDVDVHSTPLESTQNRRSVRNLCERQRVWPKAGNAGNRNQLPEALLDQCGVRAVYDVRRHNRDVECCLCSTGLGLDEHYHDGTAGVDRSGDI